MNNPSTGISRCLDCEAEEHAGAGWMMTDYHSIYLSEAENYDRLISREDFQGNILPAVRKYVQLAGADVVDLGSGTGRLACMFSPEARSITALDRSPHMLEVAAKKLAASGAVDPAVAVCDHRHLALPDRSMDLSVSGWSIAYLVEESGAEWQHEVNLALAEMERVLRPGGTVMLLETLGTGFEEPNPPEHLCEYLPYLETIGFQKTWLRTDYRFDSLEEAVEMTGFFFGEELAARVRENRWVILPECTGIWSRTRG